MYAATRASTFSELSSGIADLITVLAIIVGGVWAYFRFVKDRTYRPRVELSVRAGYLVPFDGQPRHLLCMVWLRNIGGTKLALGQTNSGILLSRPAENGLAGGFASEDWLEESEVSFTIFPFHAWLESHELIEDCVLIRPTTTASEVIRVEAQVLLHRKSLRDIAVYASTIVHRDHLWSTERKLERYDD